MTSSFLVCRSDKVNHVWEWKSVSFDFHFRLLYSSQLHLIAIIVSLISYDHVCWFRERIAHTTCSAMRFSIGINFQFSSFKMYENNMYLYFFFHFNAKIFIWIASKHMYLDSTCACYADAGCFAIKNNLLKCILFFFDFGCCLFHLFFFFIRLCISLCAIRAKVK